MKKLLYSLIFFISCNVCRTEVAYGQITIALSSTSQTATPGTTISISSSTYAAGNTYIFFLATKTSSGTPTDNPTISSGTLTLVKRGSIAGSFNDRIIVYTADVNSTTTTPVTFTYAETQSDLIYAIYTASKIGLLYDFAGASNTGANPSLTLGSFPNFSAVGVFINNKNPFNGTPESGWTEDFDNGNAVPVGRYGVSRSNTSDNTVTVTAAASNWTGGVLGLRAITRRIISVN